MAKIFDRKSQLVGISGTNYSGKDMAGDYLQSKHGFLHISISDILRSEARRRGLDTTRPTLIEMNVQLRERHGPDGVVLKGIEQWRRQKERYPGGLALSSVRVMAEAEEIQKQGGKLLFIDAAAGVRYRRAQKQARGDETYSNLAEYIEHEKAELEGLGGVDRPHLRAVQDVALVTIENTGSLAEYYKKLDKVLGLTGGHGR